MEMNGIVEEVMEEEMMDVVAEVDLTGMFNCLYIGVVFVVFKKFCE